jgi:tetratricopeptide (TPR) repeat protein
LARPQPDNVAPTKRPEHAEAAEHEEHAGAVEPAVAPERPAGEPLRSGWRDRWQLPVLVLSLVVLAGGLVAWVRSAPKPDYPGAFAHVERLIEAARYEDAIAFLNDPIRVSMEPSKVPAEMLSRFFVLSGDAIYLGQKARGVEVMENHDSVVTSYRAARSGLSTALQPVQQYRLSDTLVSLGRVAEAIEELEAIPEDASRERHALMRRIITLHLDGRQTTLDAAGLMRMLGELRTDPRATIEDRLWAAARQAELRLKGGYAEDALVRLIQEVQRLNAPRDRMAGELYVLMGDASLELGRFDECRNYYLLALEVLDRQSPLVGRALVGIGKAVQLGGEDDEAAEWYGDAIARFPFSESSAAAHLGLGEVLSRRGQLEDSISAFESAIEAMRRQRDDRGLARAIAQSLGQRHEEWQAQGEAAAALRYARLVERVFVGDSMPADSLERIARTQRMYADSLMAGARVRQDGTLDLSALDPVTVEEARKHYRDAGAYFARHAQRRLVGDPRESARSLWHSADSYDRAGDLDSAITRYNEFIVTQNGSPERLEALFRLARAHQARGDYARAAELFESIIRESPTSRYATMSYVPLAQSYMVRDSEPDIRRAEGLLQSVLTNGGLDPEAPEFREAKVELGRLYRGLNEHDRAIAHLREAIERYPDLREDPELVFALADSLRLSAEALGRELQLPRPPGERADLRRRRGAELREALEGFTRVRTLLASRDPRRLSEIQRSTLRGATLYRGDCAFDLAVLTRNVPPGMLREIAGDPVRSSDEWYEQAVAYYDTAAQQYASDPVSLTAMVQIVNAYMEMGRVREARTAHQRARARLADLPDSAFESGRSSMSREAWESWLAASVRLDRLAETQP